jgi:hypothetical protein
VVQFDLADEQRYVVELAISRRRHCTRIRACAKRIRDDYRVVPFCLLELKVVFGLRLQQNASLPRTKEISPNQRKGLCCDRF